MTESNEELLDAVNRTGRVVELHIDSTGEDALDLAVVDRYLSGESHPDEAAGIEHLMLSSATCRGVIERLRAVSYAPSSVMNNPIVIDLDAQWARIIDPGHHRDIVIDKSISNTVHDVHSAFDAEPAHRDVQPPYQTIRVVLPWVAFTAIVMAVGVLVGVFTTNFATRHSTSNALMTYSTAAAQRSTIELADGTRVILNVGSQIRIPENFSGGNRTVYLKGEAYFNVAHATDVPFTVETAGASTSVLGTEFSVRAYVDAPVSVAVQSGRVSVNRVVLNANDVARVRDGNVEVLHNQALETMFGFVTGHLILRDVPLRDAIQDLNRWYNVDIRVANEEMEVLPIRAILRGESIAELMMVLRLTFGVDVVRDGRVLTLYRAY